jgi:mannose-6-phosphate isomerase-like protein (cupin superfamily)
MRARQRQEGRADRRAIGVNYKTHVDEDKKYEITIRSMDSTESQRKAVNTELEKSKSHIIVEIIEYVPNSVVIKTIIKKSTGNISVMSFDTGEGLTEKTSPFDTFAQIIEGRADMVIDKVDHHLESGQGIIIPAHASNHIKPNGRFKMILTIIKSGYE